MTTKLERRQEHARLRAAGAGAPMEGNGKAARKRLATGLMVADVVVRAGRGEPPGELLPLCETLGAALGISLPPAAWGICCRYAQRTQEERASNDAAAAAAGNPFRRGILPPWLDPNVFEVL